MTDLKLSESQTHELKNTHCLDVEDFDGNRHRLVNIAMLHVPFDKGETLAHKINIAAPQESRVTQPRAEKGAPPSSRHGSEPSFSCPESILFIHPEATQVNVDVDMLGALVSRTIALVEVLDGYYQTPIEHRPGSLNDHIFSNYLWQLTGNLQLIQHIADTSHLRMAAAPKQDS